MTDISRRHRFARNTAWMTLGYGARVGFQALYFVVVARALGADGLGAFAGAVALVAIIAPFASLGAGNLLVKHVARSPDRFARYWGGALSVTLASAAALVIGVLLIAHVALPRTISLQLILSVAISDLVFARVVDIGGQAFQAHERLSRTAQFPLLLSGLRTLAALAFALMGHPTPERWAVWYAASTGVAALVSVVVVNRE